MLNMKTNMNINYKDIGDDEEITKMCSSLVEEITKMCSSPSS